MEAPLRLAMVALLGGLGVLGLALGAESQREVFLEPDLQARDLDNADGAAGNLVILTAFVVALAAAGAASLLTRRRGWRRWGAVLAVLAASYSGVLVAQSAWPSYIAQVEARFADLSNSLLAANVPAVPSLLLPMFALVLATLLGGGAALRRLFALGRSAAAPTEMPRLLFERQCAATLLAVPFLGLVAWGSVRLLLRLPSDQPGLSPYLAVLPLAAAACLALAAIAVAKAWRLGSFVRNGRLAAAVQESWQGLGRAELAIAGGLAALAIVSSAFAAADLSDLNVGTVFGVTLRGHMQFLVLLGVPLAPGLLLQRRVLRFLGEAPAHHATLEHGTDRLAVTTALAAAASIVLAGLATWAIEGAVWGWLLAFLPAAVLANARLGAADAAAPLLLLAFALWAIGNTVVARYDGDVEGALAFRDPPGLLALWRTIGAAVGAIAVSRLALRLGGGERRAVAVPLAVGVGACLAAVALLEMPLAAWLINRGQGEAIAVGSLVASQDPPVRILLHAASGLLGVAAALLLSRLHRPEWFRPPPPPPLAVPRPKGTKGTRPPRPAASSKPTA